MVDLSIWEIHLMSIWDMFFHELLLWRVTHFFWMIAWGWNLHMGMLVHNIYQIPCLKNSSRPHIVVSMGIPPFHDESHLDFSPKAYL